MLVAELSGTMAAFLLTKPRPTLNTAGRCKSGYHDHEGGCSRAIWGDGRVLLGKGNIRFDMCSRCWHLDQALHGKYRTMRANPAAAKLDGVGIERLTFSGQPTLPPIGAHQPSVFPSEWCDE